MCIRDRPGHAWVLGPGAVSVPPRTQLEPDVLVLPARFPSPTHWRDVSGHWLAIEVLSRSSHVYDRDFKRDAYFALGVLEVWLVDIESRTIERSRATAPPELVSDVLRWIAPVADITITIDLAALFAGISEG